MNTKLTPLTISGQALSDLFFNSPVERFNEISGSLEYDNLPTVAEKNEAANRALAADAQEFLANLDPAIAQTTELITALVEDFIARL